MVQGQKVQTAAERARFYPNPATGVGTLRIMSGRLVRSMAGAQSGGEREGIYNVTLEGSGVNIEYGTMVPYAGVNEYGFSGSVNVPAHKRTITKAFGRAIEPKVVDVKSFTRSANIPARPFLMPAVEQEMSFLVDWLRNNIDDAIRQELAR